MGAEEGGRGLFQDNRGVFKRTTTQDGQCLGKGSLMSPSSCTNPWGQSQWGHQGIPGATLSHREGLGRNGVMRYVWIMDLGICPKGEFPSRRPVGTAGPAGGGEETAMSTRARMNSSPCSQCTQETQTAWDILKWLLLQDRQQQWGDSEEGHCLSLCYKYRRRGQLIKHSNVYLTVLEAGRPRSRY